MPEQPSFDPLHTVDHVPPSKAPPFTNDTCSDLLATDTGPSIPATPTGAPDISGYSIVREIAKGGMGRVYAGHDLTLDREVAIKTLLPGASAERFITEAKITARLPHPNIPPVYALGMLPGGVPWLAMKFIHGQTLADLLKARSSPSADLPRFVQIFEQIAQAVGFAHSRGILHRDLKPLNVMVGAFGEVQVMDWGLAKDMASVEREFGAAPANEPANEHVQQTAAGAILGTPGFMAPEQARGDAVDARADVFALGSILAAILTGKPAFTGTTVKETIARAANADLSDVLARLEVCGADAELIALTRHCLAAVRETRPANGRAVATEVAAYRAGVEARLRRAETQTAEALVREAEQRKRRRTLIWAGGIIAAVLTVGLGASLWQMNRALAAEQATAGQLVKTQQAEAATSAQLVQTQIAQAATQEQLVKTQQAEADAVEKLGFSKRSNEILGSVFSGLDPKANYATVAELRNALKTNLQKAVQELDGSAIGDPLVVAEMQSRLGMSLLGLGEHEQAIALFEEARDTRKAKLGPDHADMGISLGNLAVGYKSAGKLDLALPLFEKSFALLKATLGPDHPDTLGSMSNLAVAYQDVGNLDQALALAVESFKLTMAKHGPHHPDTLMSANNLAGAYSAAGNLDQALPIYEELHKLAKSKLGPDHPDTLTSMSNLATGYRKAGNLNRALPLLEETLKLRKSNLGPDHPDTLDSMGYLGLAYEDAGNLDLALPLYEESFKLQKAKLGIDHPDTLSSMNNLATCYQAAGKPDQALPLLEESLKLSTAKLGLNHPATLTTMSNLALQYQAAGRLDLALPLYTENLKLTKAKLGPDHPDTLTSMHNLAVGFWRAGNLDQSVPLFEESFKLSKAKLGPDHPATLQSMSNLAVNYHNAGQLEQALPLFEETYKLQTAKLGADHPDTLHTMNNLASFYWDVGKRDEALLMFEDTLKLRKSKLGPDHPNTLMSMSNLAGRYSYIGKQDQALPLMEEALKLMRAKLGPDHPQALSLMNNLAAVYWQLRKLDQSIPLFEDALRLQEQKLGRGDPDTQLTVANLGRNYKDAGRFAEAIPLLEEAYVSSKKFAALRWVAPQLIDGYGKVGKKAEVAKLIQEVLADTRERVPNDSPLLGNVLAQLGSTLLEMTNYPEAEPLLRECLVICEKTQPDAWTAFYIQSLLGGALLGQKKYADAEPLLVKGYEGMKAREKTIPPPAAAKVPEALDRLIELYAATDKPAELTKYQELRAGYPAAKAKGDQK